MAASPAPAPAGAAPPPAGQVSRSGVIKATGFIVGGSASYQVGSALSVGLFDTVNVATVSNIRFIVAGLIMLALFRPRWRGRGRVGWLGIGGMAVALACNGLFLLQAMAHIDLGIVLTINFLGACGVALITSHRAVEVICALVALGGVVLIAGPGGGFDLAGFAWALGGTVTMALYTVMTEKVGKGGGLPDLSLAMCLAAVMLLPFGAPGFGDLTLRTLAALAGIAILGSFVPPCLDTLAGRASSARVVGTLFSCDPALAAVAGFILLDQAVTLPTAAGMALVTLAGALMIWSAPPNRPAGQPTDLPAS
jgi:inner membrane transporter RhtA